MIFADEINRLEKLARCVSLLESLGADLYEFADKYCEIFPALQQKHIRSARRKFRAAQRLRRCMATVAATIESKTLQTITEKEKVHANHHWIVNTEA